MSIKLESASRVKPSTFKPENLIKLETMKTKRSPQLAKMMTYFRDRERLWFSRDDLSHLGITVISLPGADTLLTNEGPFRPHSAFKPEFSREFLSSKDRFRSFGCIQMTAERQFRDQLEKKGFTYLDACFPWNRIYTLHPFFGVVDGLMHVGDITDICHSVIRGWGVLRPPYLEPQQSESLATTPPHVHLTIVHHCCPGEDAILSHVELKAIVTAIHNRVYEAGFENETLFPVGPKQLLTTYCRILMYLFTKVLVFSAYPSNRIRIIEAVFDITCEKLCLRITPLHTFDDIVNAPWDAFLQMYASSPKVSSSHSKP